MEKLLLILTVSLVLVSRGARWKPNYTTTHRTLCRAYCIKFYYDCFEKYNCRRPEGKYRVAICKEEYSKCYAKCLEEVYVLDMEPRPKLMSPKNREILLRLLEELDIVVPEDI